MAAGSMEDNQRYAVSDGLSPVGILERCWQIVSFALVKNNLFMTRFNNTLIPLWLFIPLRYVGKCLQKHSVGNRMDDRDKFKSRAS